MSSRGPASSSTSTSSGLGGSALVALAIGSPGRRSQLKRTIDGKRSGASGWEFVHVMVDDHSRLAYAEVFQGRAARACTEAFHSGIVDR